MSSSAQPDSKRAASNARSRLKELMELRQQRKSVTPSNRDNTRSAADEGRNLQSVASQPATLNRPQSLSPDTCKLRKAPTPHVPILVDEEQPDLWAELAKHAACEEADEKFSSKLVKEKKVAQQREFLDQQVARRKDLVKKARTAHLSERSVVDHARDVWESEQAAVVRLRKEVAASIKADRQAQVELRKEKKIEEQKEKEEVDKLILRRIEEEMAAEKVRALQIKERDRQFKAELVKANEQQQLLKKKEKDKEGAQELEYAKKFDERLDKEAKERAASFEKMKEKMRGKEAMALALQATIDERAKEDERRALEYVRRKEAKEDEEREKEERKRADALQRILQFRAKQIEVRAHARQVEVEQKAAEKLEALQVVEEIKAEAKMRREQRKLKLLKQREMAEQQIRENSRYHPVVMSEEERRLNSRLLSPSHSPER